MRILLLSNFYPPAGRGGFEEWCAEVLERLRVGGHDVRVLTSNFGVGTLGPDPAWVYRELFLEMDFAALRNAFQFFTDRKKREMENLACFRRHLEIFQPEAVMIWGMWNLERSLACLAEELMPDRVIYYMGDYWPSLPGQFREYWNMPARRWFSNLPKSLLRPLAQSVLEREKTPVPKLERVLFPSTFMRQEFARLGFTPKVAEIIHGAIDTGSYLQSRDYSRSRDYCSILYVGRLSPEKGVHTAIEAMDYLVHRLDIHNVKLTIIGSGEHEYAEGLQQLVQDYEISGLVTFVPAQPKEKLPVIYREADILIFPSIWAEPFGRVIVEGMASGLAVVGTCVGGAAEMLVEGETALTFSPEDAVGLAGQLKRMIESPALRRQLGEQSRRFAVSRFDIQAMTAGIEAQLKKMVN